MPAMTQEQIEACAKFYGIDMTEATRRYDVVQAHDDDPEDPICIGCAKRPHEIEGYVMCMIEEGDPRPSVEGIARYVIDK